MLVPEAQILDFYARLWEARDLAAMNSILHNDFTFRGPPEDENRGHRGFADYVDMVHAALDEFRCVTEDLVEEDVRVVARMRFEGVHSGPFLGFQATGKRVNWKGCAFFTFRVGKVSDLGVLRDLQGLQEQLKHDKV